MYGTAGDAAPERLPLPDNARLRPESSRIPLRSPDVRLIYELPGPAHNGRAVVRVSPLELLDRLARLIPPPRVHCAACGNGSFIARGFGPEAFQMNGRRAEANKAVHKAAGPGEPVTQEIAVSVSDESVSCSINGTVVGSYAKSELVAEGKLKSTDGIYGIRFGHNTEALVTGLTVTRN